MEQHLVTHGFPAWLRLNHFVNFLLITILIRSGIQILADFPKLYWNVHCPLNGEWIKFTKRKIPDHGYWTSLDEAVPVSPWLALPGGRHNLGIGRHWHFLSVIFWIGNGLIYVSLLFATGEWTRLIPTSWDIVPRAWHTALTYMTFRLPDASEFRPYDPLQQLAYASVVFVIAPLTILTGAAMSPAVLAHWPWYQKLFGNRQVARSLHFLLMLAYVSFLAVHVTLVVLTGFSKNMNRIVLGGEGDSNLAAAIGLAAIAAVIALNALITWYSRKNPRRVQNATGLITDNAMRLIFSNLTSRQEYSRTEISPYHWINGIPPETEEFRALAEDNFKTWRLEVHGLVTTPLSLSLDELRALPGKSQITMHNCIQGWSGIAEWGGVEVAKILDVCAVTPSARYVVFHSFDIDREGREYYGTLTIEEARHPQTLLAFEMNGKPLPPEHGAPLRLRVETKLGFKMVKYLRSIEIVQDIASVGMGQGGYREDTQYFGTVAGI